MSGFLDRLRVEPLRDGTWVTLERFRWQNGRTYEVPPLFRHDFASVPRVVPTLLAGLLTLLLTSQYGFSDAPAVAVAATLAAWAGLVPTGRHQWAAVVHDYLYYSREVTRREADHVFLDAMRDAGVPLLRRWAMFAAVRLFGGWSRWLSTRERAAGVNRVLDRLPDKFTRLPPTGIERVILAILGRTKEA